MKKILFLLAISIISLAACTKKFETENAVRLNGKIEKLEMTTFQYGTHLIKSGGKSYALTSKRVNLDSSIGKEVVLKGTKVKGYPLEGGPELIEVHTIN